MLSAFLFNIAQKPLFPIIEWIAGSVLKSPFPELWKQLRKWDDDTWQKFRADYSVRELEMRFELEKEWLAAGKNIRCRNFYTELKERIMRKQDVPI